MGYHDWPEYREGMTPGQGQGQGKPRQGGGGFEQCICPQCGYETKHDRGTPCNSINCPECGTALTGN